MSDGSLSNSTSCMQTKTTVGDPATGIGRNNSDTGLRDISQNHDFGATIRALKDRANVPFRISERRVQPSNAALKSETLNTIEFEIFKITEMARRWIVENGLSPYKLALTTGTSPSQVHRIMEPGWTPSLKLARRIASTLPEDWVNDFELDCNACLPRLFHLHHSPELSSDSFTQLLCDIEGQETGPILDSLIEGQFSVRRYAYLSRTEMEIVTANHTGTALIESDYAPPPPRVIWSSDAKGPRTPSCVLLIHRVPIKVGDRINLYSIHIAEYSGKNWATQVWKIDTSKDLTSMRQLDILKAYLAENA